MDVAGRAFKYGRYRPFAKAGTVSLVIPERLGVQLVETEKRAEK
jgi:hypothetical protein